MDDPCCLVKRGGYMAKTKGQDVPLWRREGWSALNILHHDGAPDESGGIKRCGAADSDSACQVVK